MATPIVEQIAQKIEARLKKITTANGYSHNAVVTRRTRMGGFTPQDKSIALYQGQRFANERHTTQGGTTLRAHDQHFGVAVYAIDSDKSTIPADTLLNAYESEALQALTTPETVGADWVKMDGLAITSRFDDPVYLIDGQFAVALLDLVVTYRTPENDPYTAA